MAMAADFPNEILEKILHYLDGKSLLHVRKVCKRWKILVDHMLQRFNPEQWHWLCLDTIPTNFLIEYLASGHCPRMGMEAEQQDQQLKIDTSWVPWKTVFKNHQALNNSDQWKKSAPIQLELDIDADPITCVKVTGDFAIIGHRSGLICLWILNDDPEGLLIDVYEQVHNHAITEVKVADAFHQAPYQLSSDDKLEYFSNHHFMISASSGGKVQAQGLGISHLSAGSLQVQSNRVELVQHTDTDVHVGLMNNILAIFGTTIALWEIQVPPHFKKTPWKLPRMVPMRSLRGPDSMFLSSVWPNKMAFWMQKFVVMDRSGKANYLHYSQDAYVSWMSYFNGKSMTLVRDRKPDVNKDAMVMINNSNHFGVKSVKLTSLPKTELLKCLGHVPEQSLAKPKLDLASTIIWAKLFHDDLFILMNRRRQLLISVDGCYFKACGPFKDQHKGHVTCVAYYANVLVMGFSSGHLWIYFTKDPIDLLSWDFQKPSVALQADIKPILNIDIGSGVKQGHICLIAGCEDEAYYFKVRMG